VEAIVKRLRFAVLVAVAAVGFPAVGDFLLERCYGVCPALM